MTLPLGILSQHVAVLGKTRSGKSSVMRGLVEGLLERELPVCIVDPKGDWYGIKLSADGKRPGYPVIIFGGEHADIPINEHSGAHVAELFATGNRPCLIDLGGWMVAPRTRFWIDFASTLFKHTKGNRWLAVDEIHNFAPKGKVFDADAGKALHWTNRLASEGLGKGLAMLFASQRPQKVHNDTLTSAETLIAMRVLHPSDRGAVADWIKGCGDSEGSEVLNSLAQMERGEGWVWSPEIGFGPKRVKFPMFKTYDSFRPQSVDDTKRLKGWAEVNLDEVRARMAATIEKARADDPKALRARIAELERAAKVAPTKAVEKPVVDRAAIDRAANEGYERGRRETISAVLKSVLPLRDLARTLDVGLVEAIQAAGASVKAPTPNTPPIIVPPFAKSQRVVQPRPPAESNGHGKLPPGELAVLKAAASYADGVERDQLSVLTGYKRSSRDAYIVRLSQKAYIEVNGATITATGDGVAALGRDFEPLPTGDALQSYWLDRLPPGEEAVLRVLIAAYPESVDRAAIDEQTNYKRSSRDAYIVRLGARRLVTTNREGVRASDTLFDA